MGEGLLMIGEFLLELSEDPRRLAEYAEDPKRVLGDSGLTEQQQEVLLSGDLRTIREAIRQEYADARVIVIPLPCQHVAVSEE